MARPPRTIDPSLSYHVFCRGSNRGRIVWDSLDCESFRDELARVAVAFEWDVLAWCLMDNHHHLVLRAEQERFSAGLQQLNGNHSRRTNRRHGRSDHLFRNRPRALAIETTSHLIDAIAYVVRNPVAAEMAEHAAEWRWSSYRATVGLESAPAWLLVDEVLELFGRNRESARRAFAQLVHYGHVLVSDTNEEEPLALTSG